MGDIETNWTKKHILGIEDLSASEIKIILDQSKNFKEILLRPIPKVPTLRGITVVNMFCEPSTRTRISFELAIKRIGADVVNFSAASSSFTKGETLKDTVRNIEIMRAEIMIVRHSVAGTPHFLTQCVDSAIINAGDGCHEHPTQALLDVFTIQEKLKNIEGLNVSIIGDIAHSRVAKSDIYAFQKLGANVTVCGPKTLMPMEIEKLGVKVTYDIKEAISNADVVNVLRIQLERQNDELLPSIREYRELFGINNDLLNRYAKNDVVIMHPGPINRDVELSGDVADGKRSVILDQVLNGVASRMALLFLLTRNMKGIQKDEDSY